MPDQLVKIFDDETLMGTTTATASGFFSTTLPAGRIGGSRSLLTAMTCLATDGDQCSKASAAVELVPNTSFFCPQLSTWEDRPVTGPQAGQQLVYRFRNPTGRFVSNGWQISAPFSFTHTQLHLYVLACPAWTGATGLPDAVWVTIENEGSFSPASTAQSWYHFDISTSITSGHREISLNARCTPSPAGERSAQADISVSGGFGVNRGGTLFDLGPALDLARPSLQPRSGVTITLLISRTEWGGWTPWPAQAFGGQSNPQVTGVDGFFSFQAPPDLYYLQAAALPGYQAWRSPVFTDSTTINVPYTPLPQRVAGQVTLTEDGPSPARIQVDVGQSVEWVVVVQGAGSSPEHLAQIDFPTWRVVSDRDPLALAPGWDSGMLAPGQGYGRQFNTPGSYGYSDGAGHRGEVMVRGESVIYLPSVTKSGVAP